MLGGNQGRSAGATTREGGGVPVGNAGDVLRARGGGERVEKGQKSENAVLGIPKTVVSQPGIEW